MKKPGKISLLLTDTAGTFGRAQATIGHRAAGPRSQLYYLGYNAPRPKQGLRPGLFRAHTRHTKEEIATVGDQSADILMFERPGFSIASDKVEQGPDAVTNSNKGLANALERFLLAAPVNEVTP